MADPNPKLKTKPKGKRVADWLSYATPEERDAIVELKSAIGKLRQDLFLIGNRCRSRKFRSRKWRENECQHDPVSSTAASPPPTANS